MNSASNPSNPAPQALGQRFLHLTFPRLSTDRLSLATERPEGAAPGPLAAYETVGQAVRLVAVNAAAEAAGLEPGLTLKAARARLPEFQCSPHDALADARLLQRLAGLCRRFTPAVILTPPRDLRLNLTGCGRLFGDEAALVAELLSRLRGLGLSVRHGLADTPGLAFALCFWGAETEAGPEAGPGVGEAALAPLPVAALALDASDEAALVGLGLRRVGQLLSRASFVRSGTRPGGDLSDAFEGRLSRRLDEVLGRTPEPLPFRLEPPPFRAERRLFEPVWLEPQILGLTRRLAEDLCEQMARRGRGARQVALDLFRVDGAVKRLTVRTARPLRDPEAIARLFESRLAGLNEGLEADFGFDQLRLSALRTEDALAQTRDILGGDDAPARFALFAESVQARLGPEAVRIPRRDPSTQKPEREWGLARLTGLKPGRSPGDLAPERPAAFAGTPLAPLRLFRPPQPIEVTAGVPEDPPARFVWRRMTHRIVRAEGPERLAPEWVREPQSARTRDYYRVEDETGGRFWLFREGLYDGVENRGPAAEAREPLWFLHGMFA